MTAQHAPTPTPGAAPRPTNPAIGAAPGTDPLVVALGLHILDCPICRTRGRASCPEGRTLSDAAALAQTVEWERRKGWRR